MASDTDLDNVARTVVAEAGSDPTAQLAVASVIANRLAAGSYGGTPSAVVLAPKQFEVWQNGSAQRVDPGSSAYGVARQIAADALSGAAPDPTGGSTHFFSPAGQASMGRSAPAWAGGGVKIGGNVFNAPNGPVTRPTPSAAPQAPAGGLDELSQWGVDPKTLTAAKSAAAPVAAPAAPADPNAEFGQWGLDPKTLAAQGATPAVQAPNLAKAAQAVAAPQSDPGGDASAAMGRGALEGVPIAGPYILSGANKLAAVLRSVKENVPYSQALDEVQKFSDATGAEHPNANTAGNVLGAVAGMAPAIAAAPEAFGVKGASMLSRLAYGGASGAAVGGADAVARGDGAATGAGFGALGGMAGPAIGQLAGKGLDALVANGGQTGNALINYLRTGSGSGVPGVGRAAADLFGQVVHDPAAVEQFLAQHGPLAMPADADPSLTALAGGLASKPGTPQAVIRNALIDRAGSADQRIVSQIESTVGPNPGSVRSLDDAYAGIRSAADSEAYPAVHANAPPVDVSGVVDTIDHQLATATGPQRAVLQRMRGELVTQPAADGQSEQLVTDSRTLHNVRQDLDNTIRYGDTTTGVQPGTLSRTQGSVGTVRGALDDALKSQVPGMAEADARSSLNAANQNAVTEGSKAVFGANVPHPADFMADRDANNPATNAAMNAGMASRIHQAFGTGTQRDTVTLNKLLAGGEDGYSAQNLGTAFGQGPTNALLDTLARERAFQATTQAVTQNSETARRAAANKLLDATQPGSMDLRNVSTLGLGLQGAKALANPLIKAIMESPDAPRNMELARVLTAQGVDAQTIVQRLNELNSRNARMVGVGAGVRAAVDGGLNRLLLAAGATRRP